MRIISGKFRGRKLFDCSNFKNLRPTTDKNRESLFNILSSAKFAQEIGFNLSDCNVLDICCGTGAVAFEAISRGANSALLIDKNFQHLEIAKKNAKILSVENQVKFLIADAENFSYIDKIYNLIFIDPPYSNGVESIILNLVRRKIVDKNSLIVIESEQKICLDQHLRILEIREYGRTCFTFAVIKSDLL